MNQSTFIYVYVSNSQHLRRVSSGDACGQGTDSGFHVSSLLVCRGLGLRGGRQRQAKLWCGILILVTRKRSKAGNGKEMEEEEEGTVVSTQHWLSTIRSYRLTDWLTLTGELLEAKALKKYTAQWSRVSEWVKHNKTPLQLHGINKPKICTCTMTTRDNSLELPGEGWKRWNCFVYWLARAPISISPMTSCASPAFQFNGDYYALYILWYLPSQLINYYYYYSFTSMYHNQHSTYGFI